MSAYQKMREAAGQAYPVVGPEESLRFSRSYWDMEVVDRGIVDHAATGSHFLWLPYEMGTRLIQIDNASEAEVKRKLHNFEHITDFEGEAYLIHITQGASEDGQRPAQGELEYLFQLKELEGMQAVALHEAVAPYIGKNPENSEDTEELEAPSFFPGPGYTLDIRQEDMPELTSRPEVMRVLYAMDLVLSCPDPQGHYEKAYNPPEQALAEANPELAQQLFEHRSNETPYLGQFQCLLEGLEELSHRDSSEAAFKQLNQAASSVRHWVYAHAPEPLTSPHAQSPEDRLNLLAPATLPMHLQADSAMTFQGRELDQGMPTLLRWSMEGSMKVIRDGLEKIQEQSPGAFADYEGPRP